jgi:hypothetical protein
LTEEGKRDGWFDHDLPSVQSATSNSWYARLSAAATSMVINMIHLRLGYHARKYNSDDTRSCALLLERIPTRPLDDGIYPPFPVLKQSISEWVQSMTCDDMDHDDDVNMTTTDNVSLIRQDIHTGRQDMVGKDLEDSVTKSKQPGLAWEKRVQTELSKVDFGRRLLEEGYVDPSIDPEDYQGIDFPNPISFGTTQPEPPRWTPFLAAFASADHLGRAYLHVRELIQQEKMLQVLIHSLEERRSVLTGLRNDLMEQAASYEKTRQAIIRIEQDIHGEESSLRKMQKEQKYVKQDTDHWAGFINMFKKAGGGRVTDTHLLSPYDGSPTTAQQMKFPAPPAPPQPDALTEDDEHMSFDKFESMIGQDKTRGHPSRSISGIPKSEKPVSTTALPRETMPTAAPLGNASTTPPVPDISSTHTPSPVTLASQRMEPENVGLGVTAGEMNL